jgi:hypothetical protein
MVRVGLYKAVENEEHTLCKSSIILNPVNPTGQAKARSSFMRNRSSYSFHHRTLAAFERNKSKSKSKREICTLLLLILHRSHHYAIFIPISVHSISP